jgi:ribonuclease Z
MKINRFLTGLVAALLLAGGSPASNAAEDDGLTVTFIGTGSPRIDLNRSGPSILVEAAGKRFLVDVGPGARERIYVAGGFDLISEIDHVLLTHLHYDHVANVPDLWIAGWLYGRSTPLFVQGPSGTEEALGHIKAAYAWDVDYRIAVGIPEPGSVMTIEDVRPGVVYQKDGVRITAFEVTHMPVKPETLAPIDFHGQTLGYRFDYRGRSVVLSGDTRSVEGDAIDEMARGVDLLIHETKIPDGAARTAVSLAVHTTPQQAGELFARTRPRMAVYSHIIPPETSPEELIGYTRPFYEGPVTVAHDLMEIKLRGDDDIIVGERERTGTRSYHNPDADTSIEH